ncbi:hypothetical protein [Longimicrobium sp.]|nr:hypothetical protein [Longimicrobium sp.]HEX6040964.1 hypothetical protein [Longimicrobium sp.]
MYKHFKLPRWWPTSGSRRSERAMGDLDDVLYGLVAASGRAARRAAT